MKKVILVLITFVFIGFVSHSALGQKIERVRFLRGASEVTVKGTVRGYAYRDYLVRASAGQTLNLKLSSTGSPSVFTVLLPNRNNLEGAAESDDFRTELPVNGDYTVRVLMMRSAARRKGSASNYNLRISVR